MTSRRNNEEWISALTSDGSDRDAALQDLRRLLLGGLRRAVAGRASAAEGLLEDFAQEAMVRILDRLDSFRGESQFATWALAVAVRVAFAEMRRLRWRDVSLDEAIGAGTSRAEMLEDTADPPDVSLARGQISEVMHRVIEGALTAKQRQALLAELGGDMPLDEVARRMGTTRNALYKLLHDARVRLKREMLATGITPEVIRDAFKL